MTFATGRVTVSTTGVPLVSNEAERCDIGIQIYSSSGNTGDVYIGNSTGVTADSSDTTDGYPIAPNTSLLVTDRNPNEIFAISESGAQKLWYIIV